MVANYLGAKWRAARTKRIKQRQDFLMREYGISEEEAYAIAWELERLAAKERRFAKAN